MTLIDIFNDRYESLGTEDKKIAHAKGLWHRTFSALAINPTTRRVFLQKKAPGAARQVLYRPSPPTPELLLRVLAGLRRL